MFRKQEAFMYYVFVISNFVYVKFNFDDVITQEKQVKGLIRINLNLYGCKTADAKTNSRKFTFNKR